METVRVALCQLLAGGDKLRNLEAAAAAVAEAASHGAKIIALPECFNSPYATDQFPLFAEPIPATRAELDPSRHPSSAALSAAAAAHGVYLIGGERETGAGAGARSCVPAQARRGARCCRFGAVTPRRPSLPRSRPSSLPTYLTHLPLYLSIFLSICLSV